MLNPGWMFVPTDLDYFIEYEIEDRKACPQASKKPETATCRTASNF